MRWAAILLPLALSAGAAQTPTDTQARDSRTDAVVRPAPPRFAAELGTAGPTTKVLAISVDSMGSRAVRLLGPDRAPTLYRMMRQGAGTLNARTAREQTETLPNHTSMVTGRRIDADRGGHGVTWNDNRLDPATVQEAAGHPVSSVFQVVHRSGGSTGMFVSKTKLALFERSWPRSVDRSVVRLDNRRLVRIVRRDLVRHRRAFTLVHLSGPDVVGHAEGFLSPAHLDAVAGADRQVGRLLRAIQARPRLRDHLTVVLTADHGGAGDGHADPAKRVNYTVPFVVWGAGVAAGGDLYDLNPDYRNPGSRRTGYAQRQPVRNGDVANLALDLLALPAVRHSEMNAAQDLDVS